MSRARCLCTGAPPWRIICLERMSLMSFINFLISEEACGTSLTPTQYPSWARLNSIDWLLTEFSKFFARYLFALQFSKGANAFRSTCHDRSQSCGHDWLIIYITCLYPPVAAICLSMDIKPRIDGSNTGSSCMSPTEKGFSMVCILTVTQSYFGLCLMSK